MRKHPQPLWQCYDAIYHQEEDRRIKGWHQFVNLRGFFSHKFFKCTKHADCLWISSTYTTLHHYHKVSCSNDSLSFPSQFTKPPSLEANRVCRGVACEYSRLLFAPATTCETRRRVSHVVAGANKRRLYSQATPRHTRFASREGGFVNWEGKDKESFEQLTLW